MKSIVICAVLIKTKDDEIKAVTPLIQTFAEIAKSLDVVADLRSPSVKKGTRSDVTPRDFSQDIS
jgi:uncharacterized membrane protein (GlpM family)